MFLTKESMLMNLENAYAPEEFKNLKRVKIDELPKTFTVDKISLLKFKKKNDDGEYITKKNGETVYGYRVYVSVDNKSYFTSTSRLLVSQVKDDQETDNEGFNTVNLLEPVKVKISTEKVPYKDKSGHVETYDNPYLEQVQ